MNATGKCFGYYSHVTNTWVSRTKATAGEKSLSSFQTSRPCFRRHRYNQRYGVRPTSSSNADISAAEIQDVDEFELARKLQGLMWWEYLQCDQLKTPRIGIGLELQACIDKGSYASIYRAKSFGRPESSEQKPCDQHAKYAWQGAAGTIFAVKVLRSSMADSVSIRDFRREALLLGRLDHPSIIKMYHFAKLPQPFMVGDMTQSPFAFSTHIQSKLT